MAESQFHILNGDSLKNQFRRTLPGDIIVLRECLVDGDVSGDSLEELLNTRAGYMNRTYGVSLNEYQEKSVREFDKFKNITADSVVNLWFEEDLFCQVNLWFTAHLILENRSTPTAYLIRPTSNIQYGFGGMNSADLEMAFDNRQEIPAKVLAQFGEMWSHYQNADFSKMISLSEKLNSEFPFIKDTVKAHINRFPADGSLGQPEKTLLQVSQELDNSEFDPVFKEFSKRESIYGFGDIQVKRMLDELLRSNSMI